MVVSMPATHRIASETLAKRTRRGRSTERPRKQKPAMITASTTAITHSPFSSRISRKGVTPTTATALRNSGR
jgi:hypothetical protein